MSTPREHADITKVVKKDNIYTVHGVSNGNPASFHVDAKTIDNMSPTKAKEFMQRNIRNLATKE